MAEKQVLLEIPNVYTAHAFVLDGKRLIGAGSETDPVVKIHNLQKGTSASLKDCPGGMMSFLPIPGEPHRLVSVMGLYPPFIGGDAGLFLHERDGDDWVTKRCLDLPFAHRCEFLPGQEENVLVAATVSRHKKDPSDWSLPGEVHAIIRPGEGGIPWKSEPVDDSVTRNHGMLRTWIHGTEMLVISGREGILSLGRSKEGAWQLETLFGKEVSELVFLDMDGDGHSELATIEPFHGDLLNIYKLQGNEWVRKYSGPLSFGHGLSGGFYNGRPVLVAGNRSGSLSLEAYTVADLESGDIRKSILEEGAGPTQTQVFRHNGTDYILSANQKFHEVAVYTGPPG